jgi:hypothetical protein
VIGVFHKESSRSGRFPEALATLNRGELLHLLLHHVADDAMPFLPESKNPFPIEILCVHKGEMQPTL